MSYQPWELLQFPKKSIRTIDIRINLCHTSIIIAGGNDNQIAILRKEEVMLMDSSTKLSAVASLLN